MFRYIYICAFSRLFLIDNNFLLEGCSNCSGNDPLEKLEISQEALDEIAAFEAFLDRFKQSKSHHHHHHNNNNNANSTNNNNNNSNHNTATTNGNSSTIKRSGGKSGKSGSLKTLERQKKVEDTTI